MYKVVKELLNEAWEGEPIRHLGVRLSDITENESYQKTFFDDRNLEKSRALDKTIDEIRFRFGKNSVMRSIFLNTRIKPLTGGSGDGHHPIMSSIL